MVWYDSMNFMHLLLFVYWLGGDLGTYYSSYFVRDPSLSVDARTTALKIMAGVDMGPRICMPLIFAIGVHLAQSETSLAVPSWVVAATWLVSLIWLAMVFAVHHKTGTEAGKRLARFDMNFRVVVVVVIVAVALYGLATGEIIRFHWIAYKLLVFAALVAAGLMIRRNLVPFGPAFQKLVTQGPSAEVNDAITRSLKRCLPYVYFIWVGLLANAAMGLNLYNLFRG